MRNIPALDDPQARVIAATVDGVRIVCAYMPNGQAVGSDKYEYKLKWLRALKLWLRDELTRHPRLALLGDYNIAPEDAMSMIRKRGRDRYCALSRNAMPFARCSNWA